MYTAVVLTKDSKRKLLETFSDVIPVGYEPIAHHMTINMGKLSNGPAAEMGFSIGDTVLLEVISLAADDKVIAIGVKTDVPSKNTQKHITLAVNRNNGGKPFMSNKLRNWNNLPEQMELFGSILEIG